MEQTIISIINEVLSYRGNPYVDLDSQIEDIMSSLDLLDIIISIEDKLNILIEDSDYLQCNTVRDLVELIEHII